jgi:hypothetical protein
MEVLRAMVSLLFPLEIRSRPVENSGGIVTWNRMGMTTTGAKP